MIRILTISSAILASVACATAEPTPPTKFVVLEENVSVPYSPNAVSGFERVDDDTYLLKINSNRWYKAELSENCGRGVRKNFMITVDTGVDPSSRIDASTSLILDETHRCRIQKLDRIEAPKS